MFKKKYGFCQQYPAHKPSCDTLHLYSIKLLKQTKTHSWTHTHKLWTSSYTMEGVECCDEETVYFPKICSVLATGTF